MGPNLVAGTSFVPSLKSLGRGGGEKARTTITTINLAGGRHIQDQETEQQNLMAARGGGGGHQYSGPPVCCGLVTQVHIQYDETEKGGSLPGLILEYERS